MQHQFKFIGIIGVTALTLSLLLGNAESQIPPDLQVQIDSLIAEFIKGNNVPGMALSIVKNNDEIVYATGYGFSDVEEGIATSDATTFAIGSVTKSFVAAVIVKALHEHFPDLGESVLDTPIRALAPSFNFTLGDRYRSESTTFRDLLAHRTCLLPEYLGIDARPYASAAEFVYRQRYAPEDCQFRTEFVYNIGIIVAAGEVIGHIGNSTFEQILQELFTEIGMNDSTWVKDSDDHNSMPGRSAPYYEQDGKLVKMNPELLKSVVTAVASGGILSSARDMAKYMNFHLNYGKVGDVQVIPEDVMKWIYRASALEDIGSLKSEETDKIDKNYAYALCLSLAIYNGWQILHHGGYLPPYQSLLTLAPGLNLGIFTSTSGPGPATNTLDQKSLHTLIFEILRGANSTQISEKRLNLIQVSKRELKSSSSLEKASAIAITFRNKNKTLKIAPGDVVGSFGSGMSGEVEGSLRENAEGILQPYISYGMFGQAWLKQVTDSNFQIVWDSDIYQVYLAEGSADDPFEVEFIDNDSFVFTQSGYPIGTAFIRNVTLEGLPVVPWEPDSCGLDSRKI